MGYWDEFGNVVAEYAYDAFGNIVSKSGHLARFGFDIISEKRADLK